MHLLQKRKRSKINECGMKYEREHLTVHRPPNVLDFNSFECEIRLVTYMDFAATKLW
jgi:hypothetical protein